MSKEKSNNYGNVIMIPESVVERFITLMEESDKKENERKEKDNPTNVFKDELNFIKSQIKLVEEKMKTLKIGSAEYMELVHTYDKLLDVIRYIP